MTDNKPQQSADDRARSVMRKRLPATYDALEAHLDEIQAAYIALLLENNKTKSNLRRAKTALAADATLDPDYVNKIQFNYDNRMALLEALKFDLGKAGRKLRNFDELRFFQTAQRLLPADLFNEILDHAKGQPGTGSAAKES